MDWIFLDPSSTMTFDPKILATDFEWRWNFSILFHEDYLQLSRNQTCFVESCLGKILNGIQPTDSEISRLKALDSEILSMKRSLESMRQKIESFATIYARTILPVLEKDLRNKKETIGVCTKRTYSLEKAIEYLRGFA